MAFGFSPKYHRKLSLDNLTNDHFLVLGAGTIKKLGWSLGHIDGNSFVAYTEFSVGSWSEEVTAKIEDGTILLKSECAGSQVFDWGKNKHNIEDFISTFHELRNQIAPGELDLKAGELRATISSTENNPGPTPFAVKTGFKNILSVFIPTKGYVITPVVINLNIVIFLLMVASGVSVMLPDGESLIKWGANFRPVTLDGQAWRLFTSCFVHIGIFHILMNMYALAYIGVLLEPQLGKSRFAAAYVLTGLVGSATSLWWHDLTISAGASGAIFGLYGVFLAMLTTDLIEKSARKTLITSVVVFISFNLVNGLKGGIDNSAHLGGLVSGILIGFIFIPSLRDQDEMERKIKALAIVAVLSLGVVYLAYKNIRNDIAEYDKGIKDFVAWEDMALDYYRMPVTTPKEQKLSELKDRGIYYWNESLKLIKDLDKLSLPDEVHARDAKLIEYCELRMKSYDLMYKAIDEGTDRYEQQIDSMNVKIKGILDSFQKK